MKMNTFLGLKGHGEKGACKFGDARSWTSGEMGSI
jgi:glycosylphosphatidylinositol transamidase (GPIT) subunit GPI8